MKKITITFRQLFDVFSENNNCNELNKLKKKLYVKTPYGELTEIKGIIKKTNQKLVKLKFKDNTSHICADKHLLKTKNGFKFSNDLNKNDVIIKYNEYPTLINSIQTFSENDYSYDISLDSPHEYITPNNLIHHNTTIARILVDEVSQNTNDVMVLNGSDTNGVNEIRDLEGFCKSPPLKSKHKIIFIDEADFLTVNSQALLRGYIEKYEEIVRWVFTCNYVSKLSDAVRSRLQDFQFDKISEEFAFDYCKSILDAEEVEFEEDDVKLVIKTLYPDIRKVVNTIQKYTVKGKLKGISASKIITEEKKIIALIIELVESIGKDSEKSTINKNMSAIQKILMSDKEPDYRTIYDELFKSVIPPWAKIKVNQYANQHQSSAIPPIHFAAMLWEILSAGKQYIQLFKPNK